MYNFSLFFYVVRALIGETVCQLSRNSHLQIVSIPLNLPISDIASGIPLQRDRILLFYASAIDRISQYNCYLNRLIKISNGLTLQPKMILFATSLLTADDQRFLLFSRTVPNHWMKPFFCHGSQKIRSSLISLMRITVYTISKRRVQNQSTNENP